MTISATAEDKNVYDDLGAYVDQLAGDGFNLLGQVPQFLTSLVADCGAGERPRLDGDHP